MDKKKIASKIDELDGYIKEIDTIKPATLEEYNSSIEKKRACERTMQLTLEVMIDISHILVSELKLGLPPDEDALFDKLKQKGVLSDQVSTTCKEMKGFRNILVHKYGEVKDEEVFENLQKLNDFEKFKEEVLAFLKNYVEKNGKKKEK